MASLETNASENQNVTIEGSQRTGSQRIANSQPPSFFEDVEPTEVKKEPIHPFEEYNDFKKHPPIPVFNYIINSKTGELIEDKTGQP
jgi:hypothetical protein